VELEVFPQLPLRDVLMARYVQLQIQWLLEINPMSVMDSVVGLRSRREEEEEETLTKVPGVERGSDAVGELGRSPASEPAR
jgi:hypothetical protein